MKSKLPPAVVSFVVVIAVAILSAPAFAALPAPTWLPGQPMLAGTQVIAMWLPVPGAVKYILYIDGKKIMESPANQYIGTAPAAGGEHKFQISAIDGAGKQSPLSQAGIIKIVMIEPPTELVSRHYPDEKSVSLRWSPSSGAAIYNLYRGDTEKGPFDLIVSLRDIAYKDSGLKYDHDYFYAVTAKDINGKESSKTAVEKVRLAKPVAAKDTRPVLNLDLHIARTRQGETIDFIGDYAITPVSVTKRGPDGASWIVTEKAWFFQLSDGLGVNEAIHMARPTELRPNIPFQVGDFTFSSDGDTIYYTIPGGGFIVAAKRSDGSVIWAKQCRYPSEDEEPEIYKNRPKGTFDNPIPMLTAVTLLEDGTLYVGEEKSPLRFLVDSANGELLGWQESFTIKGNRIAGNPAWQFLGMPDGTVLVIEPIGRRILRINPETGEIVNIIGAVRAGYLGGFLGIRGAYLLDSPNWLIVGDPAYGTVQVFDLATTSYLFHIGDETGKPDPTDPSRASYKWSYPAFPIVYNGGKNILIYNGLDKSFVSYQILDDFVSVGAPVVEEVKKRLAERKAAEKQ